MKIINQAHDLTTDGCSMSPDMDFRACCAEHDFYYRNDVGLTRKEADAELFRCINRRSKFPVAAFYWAAVRLFGKKAWRYEEMKWFKV